MQRLCGRTEPGWYKALKEGDLGISLAVQWLSAGGVGSISGWGAKILHASWLKKQNIKQKQYCNKFNSTVQFSRSVVSNSF